MNDMGNKYRFWRRRDPWGVWYSSSQKWECLISYAYVFLGTVSFQFFFVQFFSLCLSFYYWAVSVLYIYYGHKVFIRYIIWKYFSQFVAYFFIFLIVIFWSTKASIWCCPIYQFFPIWIVLWVQCLRTLPNLKSW